jgi:hypothetical protein
VAFAPYVSLTDVKAWLPVSDNVDDDVINNNVIGSVTRWVDEFCQRNFWQDGSVASPVARTFAASCWCELDLGAFNDLVSVTTLKTDEAGDGVYETTWATTDYQLAPFNNPTGRPFTRIEAIAGRNFPIRYSARTGRADRVEITGVWGWPAVPDMVKQACLIQSSRILKRRNSPEGVAGFGDFGVIRISGRLDPDVEQMLNPFRRVVVLVA